MFEHHHVTLSVADLATSVDFYERLGFVERLRWDDPEGSLTIVHLQIERSLLELFAYTEPKGEKITRDLEDDLRRIGIRHFALRSYSLENALTYIQAKGLKPHTEIKAGRTGIRYFFLRDPDGNFVEIVEDRRDFMPTLLAVNTET
jgi:glyoxylase I family protein